MSLEYGHSVGGLLFSEGFCREIRRLWEQLGNDKQNTIADIQRAKRRFEEEPSESDWTIYFVSKNVALTEDIFIVDGFPIYIRPGDRERLKGKCLDFEHNSLVVTSK